MIQAANQFDSSLGVFQIVEELGVLCVEGLRRGEYLLGVFIVFFEFLFLYLGELLVQWLISRHFGCHPRSNHLQCMITDTKLTYGEASSKI